MVDTGPVRTCIGCRKRDQKSGLIRITAGPDARVVVDHAQRLQGRGAYVHPFVECIDRACRKNVIRRALKRNRIHEVDVLWFEEKCSSELSMNTKTDHRRN